MSSEILKDIHASLVPGNRLFMAVGGSSNPGLYHLRALERLPLP